MRVKYWNMYTKIKYQFFYYKRFQILFTNINWWLTAVCSFAALSSVAAWGIWNRYPFLWSFLICVSQLLQALFPKLPYNDLLCSTKLMICQLDHLLLQIDHSWLEMELENHQDDIILKLIENYEEQYANLVSQYFAGTYLPEIKYCTAKAEKETEEYFNYKYPV